MSDANTPSASELLSALARLPKEERREAVGEAFRAEIGAVLDVDPDFIEEEASLPEMGADSLRLINIALRVQQLVGLAVPPNLLPVEASVGDITDLLAEALDHDDPIRALTEAHQARVSAAIAQDLHLAPGAPAGVRVSASEAADPAHVFLTGATGFLGAYLMKELAQTTTAQIHCLVRASTAEDGARRLLDNLRKFDIPAEAVMPRVVAEPGDLGSARFGLSADRFKALAAMTDVVIHNGAAVHLTQPYSQVRSANVEGTRTILHFAGAERVKPVVVVSTVGLLDTPELENLEAITEADGPSDAGLLPNGYTQSKWAGERLVEAAAETGVPAATLRVGHVIGHGVSEDLAARLAQASINAKAVPHLDKPIDYVDPDYVAGAIVAIVRRIDRVSGVYHIVNPRPFEQADLEALAAASPYDVSVVPRGDWLGRLRDAARSDPNHPLFVALDALGDPDRPSETSFVDQVLNRPRIDCRRTQEAIVGSGVVSRPAREVLIDVLLGMPQLTEVFGDVDLDGVAGRLKAAMNG